MSFTFHWHEAPFTEPIECSMDYEPANPTAFPGTKDSRCHLESMRLCGIALPLNCIADTTRLLLENEACEWFEAQKKEAEAEALIDAYA